MAKTKIKVETTVNAGIEKVWSYWTLPEHVMNWNFASDEWHCPKAKNDLRNGGKFCYTMASKDGKSSFDFEGFYDEVIVNKKIAYTLGDGRQVTIEFENEDGMTKITETFDPENINSEELQRNGWQSILNNFRKLAERE